MKPSLAKFLYPHALLVISIPILVSHRIHIRIYPMSPVRSIATKTVPVLLVRPDQILKIPFDKFSAYFRF